MTDKTPTEQPVPYREMDVQLHANFAVVNINPVPGVGQLTLKLTIPEMIELRNLMVEAVLNSMGRTEHIIHAREIETGDFIPGMGRITEAIPQARNGENVKVLMLSENGIEATYPSDWHLTVHRVIS